MSEKLPELQEILPDSVEMAEEQKREKNKRTYRRTLLSTLLMLIAAAAAAVLAAYLWLPVFQIYGSSMNPTLREGAVVVAVQGGAIERGDVIAFQVNNKILVKRVIAVGGDEVNVTEDGTVYVNGQASEEPYIRSKHSGNPDVELPYEVPADQLFVMGDSRETSVDSRHGVVGCIGEETVVGKLVLQVWPLREFGAVK